MLLLKITIETIEVVDFSAGQVRLKSGVFKHNQQPVAALRDKLLTLNAVTGIECDTRSGGLFIEYDTNGLVVPQLLTCCGEAIHDVFPQLFVPGQLRISGRLMGSKTKFVRLLEAVLEDLPGIKLLETEGEKGSLTIKYSQRSLFDQESLEAMANRILKLKPRWNAEKVRALLGLSA